MDAAATALSSVRFFVLTFVGEKTQNSSPRSSPPLTPRVPLSATNKINHRSTSTTSAAPTSRRPEHQEPEVITRKPPPPLKPLSSAPCGLTHT